MEYAEIDDNIQFKEVSNEIDKGFTAYQMHLMERHKTVVSYNALIAVLKQLKNGDDVNLLALNFWLYVNVKQRNNGRPNNLNDILRNGRKAVKDGKTKAKNLDDLAAVFGVTRKTLTTWFKVYGLPPLATFSNHSGNNYAATHGRYDVMRLLYALERLADK